MSSNKNRRLATRFSKKDLKIHLPQVVWTLLKDAKKWNTLKDQSDSRTAKHKKNAVRRSDRENLGVWVKLSAAATGQVFLVTGHRMTFASRRRCCSFCDEEKSCLRLKSEQSLRPTLIDIATSVSEAHWSLCELDTWKTPGPNFVSLPTLSPWLLRDVIKEQDFGSLRQGQIRKRLGCIPFSWTRTTVNLQTEA